MFCCIYLGVRIVIQVPSSSTYSKLALVFEMSIDEAPCSVQFVASTDQLRDPDLQPLQKLRNSSSSHY